MRTLWFMIYNLTGVPVIWIFFRLYSLFNSKVREGFSKRRDLFTELNRSLSALSKNKKVLIHSSSLGEFQQALPLVEEFRKKNYDVVLSFFSPSGFNNSKIVYDNVIKTYIPFDSISKQKRFLDLIKPDIIVFMRYDLWYNLLYESKNKFIQKNTLRNDR